MGRISKKLGARFRVWVGQYRQQLGKLKKSFPIPKDVHDVQSLVAQGYDPLHAVYIAVQNITSVFAECVSVLPELKSYYKTVGDAEEEYMPSGPPMSPLTTSYFTTWAFFTCLTDLGSQLGLHSGMVEAARQFQESRMGTYSYQEYVKAMANPKHKRHKEFLEWSGPFDPEKFDAEAATKEMRKGLPDWRNEEYI